MIYSLPMLSVVLAMVSVLVLGGGGAQLVSAINAPPALAGTAPLVSLNTALVQYSDVLLYNLGYGGAVEATTGVETFSLVDLVSASNNAADYIRILPVSCPSQQTACSFLSSAGSPLSSQLFAVQTATNGGTGLFNILGGFGSTQPNNKVVVWGDPIPQNNEAFIFNAVSVQGFTVYQIRAWNTIDGLLCVAATGSSNAFFNLQSCNSTDPNQLWAIYGTLAAANPPTIPGFSMVDLADAVNDGTLLLLNAEFNDVVSAVPSTSQGFNLVAPNTAINNGLNYIRLNAINCTSQSGQQTCAVITNPSASALSTQLFAVQTNKPCGAANTFGLFNIQGGIGNTNPNTNVVNWCDVPALNNEAFHFNAVTLPNLVVPLYQIQAWNTQSGQLCVAAQLANNTPFILKQCAQSDATQLWAIYSLSL